MIIINRTRRDKIIWYNEIKALKRTGSLRRLCQRDNPSGVRLFLGFLNEIPLELNS